MNKTRDQGEKTNPGKRAVSTNEGKEETEEGKGSEINPGHHRGRQKKKTFGLVCRGRGKAGKKEEEVVEKKQKFPRMGV